MSKYAAALDFGTSKVALAVGEKTSMGVKIISYHDMPAAGIEGGEIVNDFKVEEIVRNLVAQAEADIQEKIEEVVIGLSGRVLHSKELPCDITRPDPNAYIGEDEVRQITRARYNATVEGGETVFEAVPQKYSTEDSFGINHDELIGMVGGHIEATFKLFYGRPSILDRRITILNNCGLRLSKAILAPIASARAVLSGPEMENGVALVDIGKGLTQVAIVKDNTVRDVAVIPFGGESVSADIKSVTNITGQWAEQLKIQYGCCCEEYAVENKKLILKNENNIVDGEVEIGLLTQVIEARMSEIFDAVRFVIEQSGYAGKIASGVVITGGTSHLGNIIQLAKAILGQRIRLAAPQGSIEGGSVEPAFDAYASTAVGLVIEALYPMLSHALEYARKEVAAPAAAKAPEEDHTLFGEEDFEDEEEQESQPSPREIRRREKAERRNKKKKEKEERGGLFDLIFSDNDKA
ncbi:MAG: cell division protein FtsA [Bacteroidales bacterium]|nr:cell division protein FtsA [Bacteroidales bacterium]